MIRLADIQRIVETSYGLKRGTLIEPITQRKRAHPRQVAYYLARNVAGKSYPFIGMRFQRDHSTVIHGVRQIAAKMAEDEVLRRRVKRLEGRVRRFSGDKPHKNTSADVSGNA